MSNLVSKTITYGQQEYILETGEIARQATGAVKVTVGGTVVLVTVVAAREPRAGQDFFPLTVNYQERTYAAGRIPGGYFKREGRPSETEVLTCRLIDRPIRPLFPEGFYNEVQIVATVMSLDPAIQPDVPAMIGASAALMIAGVPFKGPIAAARVGYKDGVYLLNPTRPDIEESALDLVVAGTEHAVLMVESEAEQLSEKVMLGAVLFGHTQMQTVIGAIKEFAAEAGTSGWEYQPAATDHNLAAQVKTAAEAALSEAYLIQDKKERVAKINSIRKDVIEKTMAQYADNTEAAPAKRTLEDFFHAIEKDIVRTRILNGELRIDGRDHRTVRPITVKSGILPRVHGSCLFTRGETQAIVAATLGTQRDSQIIDALEGEYRDKFLLHYNFPPYCVGETGMVGSPKRREIGHGRLAKRGILAVLPSAEECPYVLRVVSEITESNGSSSMATVCGTSIALMDAGVKLKAPVAGIAMGLVKSGEKFAVLTDILGDEDHLGDMDFKVAGTGEGITALQMDIKIDGITKDIMEAALDQAREGRLHILDIMNGVISTSREDVSEHAPRILTIQVPVGKIAEVIGKGGSTIRALTEETGATIEIADDGLVTVAAVDKTAADTARQRIKEIITDVEAGKVYTGPITRIVDFGAFVRVLPGKEGLLHISQIANERIDKVTDVLKEGEEVTVKVLEVDRQGRMKLSIKALLNEQQPENRDTAS